MNAKVWKNLALYGLGFALLAVVIWRNWEPAANPEAGLKAVLEKPVHWLPLALASLVLPTLADLSPEAVAVLP